MALAVRYLMILAVALLALLVWYNDLGILAVLAVTFVLIAALGARYGTQE